MRVDNKTFYRKIGNKSLARIARVRNNDTVYYPEHITHPYKDTANINQDSLISSNQLSNSKKKKNLSHFDTVCFVLSPYGRVGIDWII